MSVPHQENSIFADIDRPRRPETQAGVDLITKYAKASPAVKEAVWKQAMSKRENYPDMSDEAYLALLGGTKFRNTFNPAEAGSIEADKVEEGNLEGSEKIPENDNALTGDQFIEEMKKMGNMRNPKNRARLDQYILAQIDAGHVPKFCLSQNFHPVTMPDTDGSQIQFTAGANYFAIGTDANYIPVPISPIVAIRLKQKYNWNMPTATMTNYNYDHAGKKLTGIGLVQTEQDSLEMQSADYLKRHSDANLAQLTAAEQLAVAEGRLLVAGHKKDVIISQYAIDHPDSMDFRGLYTVPGQPVQTNPAHEADYWDYASGFRQIGDTVTVIAKDGSKKTVSYDEALQDPKIARVLNGAEGAIDSRSAYRRGRIYRRSLGNQGGRLATA